MHPYLLDPKLQTRWINFENQNGAPGMGGRAASHLGIGRKGSPARLLQPGESLQLADVEGPGTLRDFWCATQPSPLALRSLVVRTWWDDQEHPSIECPLGDLMGFAHGKAVPCTTAVHSVDAHGSFHLWLPQPFRSRARMTISNDGDHALPFAFQIAATLGDAHESTIGRLHVAFRRENPTTLGRDFELLPLRMGRGRFIGAVLGVRALHDFFWGEGEVKVFVDGDAAFPTLCGPGADDWTGLAHGLPPRASLYHGATLHTGRFASLYRWHLPDPVLWQKEARVTVQQLGQKDGKLCESYDDWSCAAFWYEPTPSHRLAPLPSWEERTAELWSDAELAALRKATG
ncbi:MAG: DUF2961 domain-containing protein [Planctomycetes bacterium]|nr:DUF2961 domain-containing protein [Planctomycetota bacterium]